MQTKSIINLIPKSDLICFIVPSLFTANECQNFLHQNVKDGFYQAIANYPTYYRNNQRTVVDNRQLAKFLFERIKPYIPSTIVLDQPKNYGEKGQWKIKQLNERIRFCRYGPLQYFNRHLDGVHYRPGSLQSMLTFMVYLNSAKGNFLGGRTLFYQSMTDKNILAEYTPQLGDLIIFDHNIWHQGQKLQSGEKFIMRSDIIYEKMDTNEKAGESEQQQFKQKHKGYIWSLLRWNDQYFLSGGRDKTIRVWDGNKKCYQILQNHENSVLNLTKLSQNTLASCSRDKNIIIWKYLNNGFQFYKKWVAHENSTVLTMLKLTEDLLVSGGADSKIKIFQVCSGKQIKSLSGHQNWIWKLQKVDEDTLLSCSQDGTIRLWEWKKGKQLAIIKHHCSIQSLNYNKIKNEVYAGDLEGNLVCFSLQSYQMKWKIKAHNLLIRCIYKISDQIIATGSEDCWVRFWSVSFCKILHEYRHQNFVQDICEFNDQIISASYDGQIKYVYKEDIFKNL